MFREQIKSPAVVLASAHRSALKVRRGILRLSQDPRCLCPWLGCRIHTLWLLFLLDLGPRGCSSTRTFSTWGKNLASAFTLPPCFSSLPRKGRSTQHNAENGVTPLQRPVPPPFPHGYGKLESMTSDAKWHRLPWSRAHLLNKQFAWGALSQSLLLGKLKPRHTAGIFYGVAKAWSRSGDSSGSLL